MSERHAVGRVGLTRDDFRTQTPPLSTMARNVFRPGSPLWTRPWWPGWCGSCTGGSTITRSVMPTRRHQRRLPQPCRCEAPAHRHCEFRGRHHEIAC